MTKKREIKRNIKHRSNPFTADLVVKTKDKQVKVTSLGTDNNVLVNQETGETQGTHVVTYKKVDEQEFIKLFTANIALTFDLTAAGIKAFGVLSFALQNSINKDQVFLDELILEDFLKERLAKNREVDRLLGGSRVGCHKTDLMVKNLQKNLYAELCSSGEQKSILISLVLSVASDFMAYTKKSPIILLDEVFTHLDGKKKSSLLEKLVDLQSQIWITATEKEQFFKNKNNFSYHYLTENGL